MPTYQVKDWNKNFENAKSRQIERCSSVHLPNKAAGLGLSRVLAEEDGAAIFGIFVLIVEACSRHSRPRDGWLTRDGHPEATPWTLGDLEVIVHRPPAEIKRALDVLSSPAVGWVAVSGKCPSGDREVSAEYPPSNHEITTRCPPSSAHAEGFQGENRAKTITGKDLGQSDHGVASGCPQGSREVDPNQLTNELTKEPPLPPRQPFEPDQPADRAGEGGGFSPDPPPSLDAEMRALPRVSGTAGHAPLVNLLLPLRPGWRSDILRYLDRELDRDGIKNLGTYAAKIVQNEIAKGDPWNAGRPPDTDSPPPSEPPATGDQTKEVFDKVLRRHAEQRPEREGE